jgi:uncharacterized protein YcfL
MSNARPILSIAVAALTLAGCSKADDQQQNSDQNIALDEGLPSGVPANADIEALPADESSVTPSNQLQNGIDGSDVSDSSANAQ